MLRNKSGEVVGAAKDCTTGLDCFSLFLTDELLSKICTLTNNSIIRWLDSLSPQYLVKLEVSYKHFLVKPTNLTELKALIGLFMTRGLLKQNYWDYENIWLPSLGHLVFTSTMSKKRFSFLLRLFSFFIT